MRTLGLAHHSDTEASRLGRKPSSLVSLPLAPISMLCLCPRHHRITEVFGTGIIGAGGVKMKVRNRAYASQNNALFVFQGSRAQGLIVRPCPHDRSQRSCLHTGCPGGPRVHQGRLWCAAGRRRLRGGQSKVYVEIMDVALHCAFAVHAPRPRARKPKADLRLKQLERLIQNP